MSRESYAGRHVNIQESNNVVVAAADVTAAVVVVVVVSFVTIIDWYL